MLKSELILDEWQKEVLKTKGNIALRSGRQVGKSTVISIKAGEYAVNNPNSSIMVISATERQAYLLFSKVLAYIHDNFRKEIKAGKDRPTKSEIRLKNGSIIRCLPTGLDCLGIPGFTFVFFFFNLIFFRISYLLQSLMESYCAFSMEIVLLRAVSLTAKANTLFNLFRHAPVPEAILWILLSCLCTLS